MKYLSYNSIACRAGLILVVFLLAGCAARQVQDSLAGATAQKLVTYSIDDLAAALPEQHFSAWSGKKLFVQSNFLSNVDTRASADSRLVDTRAAYADRRLEVELARRFDIEVVPTADSADAILNVFYTSLGTDRDTKGFFLPLGFVPGMDADTRINLLTLEQFQGVAEMYYFVGETGTEIRGRVIQARTRSDALGLPIITIPINTIDRD
jgi:hypothetical protein